MTIAQNINTDQQFRKPKFKQKSCLPTSWIYHTWRMFIILFCCQSSLNLSNIHWIFGKVLIKKLSQSASGLRSECEMWQTIVRCSRRFQTRSLFFCLIRWLPIMGQGSISSLTAPAMRPSIPSLMTSLSWEDSTFAVYRLENIFQWIHNYNTISSILSSDFKWILYYIHYRQQTLDCHPLSFLREVHPIGEVGFHWIL